jgi:hypothetical protein
MVAFLGFVADLWNCSGALGFAQKANLTTDRTDLQT